MEKRKIRDFIRLTGAILFCWLYIPHLVIYLLWKRQIIDSDIARLKKQVNISLPNWLAVLYFLHNNSFYRSVFYHRIGPVLALGIGWWRPRNHYFVIPDSTTVGGGHFVRPSLFNSIECGVDRGKLQLHTLYNSGQERR